MALPRPIRALLKTRPGSWDLPELPSIGALPDIQGSIIESQKASADFFGVKHCWYGVNGATGLLQGALLSILNPGQAVLLPRNVHRSVVYACALGGIVPIFFDLPFFNDRGHSKPCDSKWFEEILRNISVYNLDIGAILFVNPTYQGYSTDLSHIIKQIHQIGLPVIVDEAHGAYFAYINQYEDLVPSSALLQGADLVVHSLHKSSIGLVQTAVIWLQGDLIDQEVIDRGLQWVQTTSPSALLLASCEAALDEWRTPKGLKGLRNRIYEAHEIKSKLKSMNIPMFDNQDPLRLILNTGFLGISGFDADSWFISKGLVGELPEPSCLTLCMGFAKQRNLIKTLRETLEALISAKGTLEPFGRFSTPPLPLLSSPQVSCGSAWRANSQCLPLREAVGRVAAELISAYPPGIPMIIPGELLDQERINWLIEQKELWKGQLSETIKVVI